MSPLVMVLELAMRAMPKSATLIRPSALTRMFCGLMSRWMMPLLCACCRAERMRMVIWAATSGLIRPRSWITCLSVLPCTYSITR